MKTTGSGAESQQLDGGRWIESPLQSRILKYNGLRSGAPAGGWWGRAPSNPPKNLMFFAMFVFFILEISPRKDEDISGGGRAAAQFNEILHRGWASFKHKDGLYSQITIYTV